MSEESSKGARISSGKPSASSPRVKAATSLPYCEIDTKPRPIVLDDLNAAGLFVACDDPPALDSEVDVVLQLGELRLHVGGHVVQVVSDARAKQESKRRGFGLLFTNVQENERAALRREIDAAHAALRDASERAAAKRSEERAVLTKLQAELRSLPSAPWSVLGVPQDANIEIARRAFFTASKRYHPHLFARYDLPEIKSTVTELFIAHKRAFATYEKVAQRSAARSTLPEGTPAPPGIRSSPPRNTSTPTNTPAPRAVPSMPPAASSPAVELDRLLSSGVKSLAAGRFDEAEAALSKAAQLDPASTNARVWLLVTQARRAKASGEVLPALEKYFEVLTIDPKHHEALAETKKHAKDAAAKPGLLGRLFGSGDK